MRTNWFSQLICLHDTLKVKRMHASTVTPHVAKKALYVDRLAVWNFIVCCDCGKVYHTNQTEKLFESEA